MKRRLTTEGSAFSGDWLVAWLNASTGHLRERNGDKGRIKILIERLRALSIALREYSATLSDFDRKSGRRKEEAAALLTRQGNHWRQCEREVYACTKRYKMRPLFTASLEDAGEIEAAFEPVAGGSMEEWQAIASLWELIRDGDLERVMTCAECQVRWVFRKKKDQRYCSGKCRQSRYEGSPKRKTRRREYMRVYYQENLKGYRQKGKKHAKR